MVVVVLAVDVGKGAESTVYQPLSTLGLINDNILFWFIHHFSRYLYKERIEMMVVITRNFTHGSKSYCISVLFAYVFIQSFPDLWEEGGGES